MRVSFFFAALIVLASGFGIVSCQRSINELSVAKLEPLVEVEGRLAEVLEKGNGLEITLKDDSRHFRCIGAYPEKFHLGNQVLNTLKAGDPIVLSVPQQELDELPQRKRWPWAEMVGLRSEGQVWLTPEGHVEWDRENQQDGVRLLWVICGAGLLWGIAILFPSIEEHISDAGRWLFVHWITNKGRATAVILALMIIPTSWDCWLEWRMRKAPMISGTIVERQKVKRFLIIPYHKVQIRPEGSDIRIFAQPRLNVPDRVEFRWDGETQWVYLRQGDGNPWRNLALITVLGLWAVASAMIISKAIRDEEF